MIPFEDSDEVREAVAALSEETKQAVRTAVRRHSSDLDEEYRLIDMLGLLK